MWLWIQVSLFHSSPTLLNPITFQINTKLLIRAARGRSLMCPIRAPEGTLSRLRCEWLCSHIVHSPPKRTLVAERFWFTERNNPRSSSKFLSRVTGSAWDCFYFLFIVKFSLFKDISSFDTWLHVMFWLKKKNSHWSLLQIEVQWRPQHMSHIQHFHSYQAT